jgi:Acyl-CoA reductase (LuxC)
MTTVLVPANATDYEQQLTRLIGSGPLPPFDALVIDFIDAVSKSVLLDPAMSRMAEMAAVAHWMRKTHVLELRQSFQERRGGRVRVARGMALHFAPSNVDSIFLYSWFLSMLVGNANVVRLSQRRGEEVHLLLEKINGLLERPAFQPLRARSLILAYDHDDSMTERLSQACEVRVLWGGDESVRRLRAVPMNPLGTELVFPTRFSLAVLNANKVQCADEATLGRLAAHFCNDAYWFDQMACSSPRLVVWVGPDSACQAAKEVFWPKVEEEIRKRNVEYPEVVGIDKLVTAYVSAGHGFSDSLGPDLTGNISRIHLEPNASADFRELECGGGFFFEKEIAGLENLPSLVSARDQTLSYFGFGGDELVEITALFPARAVDRIVPIGSALTFNTTWDGCDLLMAFSREIDLQQFASAR